VRKFTPRECFAAQGFDPSYQTAGLSDKKLYKLAGNAVSVPIAKLVLDELAKL
jgi:site-specific DNA-cytosine methylase